VGRWDDALAEVLDPMSATTKPRHRGRALLRAPRGEPRHRALTLAHSLDREQSDEPVEAFAVLMGGLGAEVEEALECADLLADAARLAVSSTNHWPQMMHRAS
jgi:hypothetical protein